MAVKLYNESQFVQSDPLAKRAIRSFSVAYKDYSETKSVQITYTKKPVKGGTEKNGKRWPVSRQQIS